MPESPFPEYVPNLVFEFVVRIAGRDPEQVVVHRTYIVVNGLIVVIEYCEQISVACSGIVESFESQSSGDGSVAYYCYDLPGQILHSGSFSEAKCR